jgi:hypothetical protein
LEVQKNAAMSTTSAAIINRSDREKQAETATSSGFLT